MALIAIEIEGVGVSTLEAFAAGKADLSVEALKAPRSYIRMASSILKAACCGRPTGPNQSLRIRLFRHRSIRAPARNSPAVRPRRTRREYRHCDRRSRRNGRDGCRRLAIGQQMMVEVELSFGQPDDLNGPSTSRCVIARGMGGRVPHCPVRPSCAVRRGIENRWR